MAIDSDEFISIAVHDDRVVMVGVTIIGLFEPAEQRNTINNFKIHFYKWLKCGGIARITD